MRMEKICKKNSGKSKFKKIVIIFIVIPILLTIAAVCAWFTLLYTGAEQVDKTKLNFTPANLQITDINGQYVDLPESCDSYASSAEIPDKLKKAFEKLDQGADTNTVKEFVKKHAEILGEKADGGRFAGAETYAWAERKRSA